MLDWLHLLRYFRFHAVVRREWRVWYSIAGDLPNGAHDNRSNFYFPQVLAFKTKSRLNLFLLNIGWKYTVDSFCWESD